MKKSKQWRNSRHKSRVERKAAKDRRNPRHYAKRGAQPAAAPKPRRNQPMTHAEMVAHKAAMLFRAFLSPALITKLREAK